MQCLAERTHCRSSAPLCEPAASELCLETQFHPDAVNHESFPSIVREPGEVWQHRTVHLFGVE